MKTILVLCAALLAICPAATADVSMISGKVIAVADGDTLTFLSHQNEKIKVRLAEIDAPEKRQPWGTRSKQSLSDLCYGMTAIVAISGYDRYKRALGLVSCGGVIANNHQVETGMAWVYRQYSSNPKLLAAEERARAEKRGLWSDTNPVPPWEFRKRK
jgi:endonuclease YncB( thermonuclease family)